MAQRDQQLEYPGIVEISSDTDFEEEEYPNSSPINLPRRGPPVMSFPGLDPRSPSPQGLRIVIRPPDEMTISETDDSDSSDLEILEESLVQHRDRVEGTYTPPSSPSISDSNTSLSSALTEIIVMDEEDEQAAQLTLQQQLADD